MSIYEDNIDYQKNQLKVVNEKKINKTKLFL